MDRIVAAEVFVAIVERGSLSAAAEGLDMSRAMVTRYLAQMEDWSGARLLHRTTRRMGLTPAGEATLVRCRQILEIAAQMAVADGPEADTPRGLLRIACAQSLAQEVLSAAVTAFLRRYPQTAVDLVVDNRTINLVEERIDLAVRITNDLDPNLIARRLGTCNSVVVAAPSYLAAHGTPRRVEDLAVHNCLTYSYFGKSLWKFTDTKTGVSSDVPVSGNLSANESMALLAAAREGAGVALQPAFAAAPPIAAGQLVRLLPEHVPQALGIHGVYSSRRQMPAALRAMLDFLVEWFKPRQGAV
ncbi:lysR substrate binding domain protein [Ralstonia insidiosa]|uniref:LysR substrate binding domain protein n=1 Tax=Ralstonia insidiosa TaxID=190721 RepID=A0AAC9BLN9_9RALS|nr:MULTISPECIES: LysR family transcriptional regulator [Ralstonia]ANH74808.1 lysR substrate binding domain protein [Ralstonia insidiosa]EPX98148.1 LysR family transcriptional regulator [Ralstonia sp. AU12-08]MBY4704265.1 LysR family transcriptional regulator [Ralstonia insidiosa]GAQ30784.1 lysR family transcriptional regulator [Ralstonia sp. NT80]